MITPVVRYNVGDFVASTQSQYVVREITAVRPTGYSWRYPDIPEKGEWISENSNDPMLSWWFTVSKAEAERILQTAAKHYEQLYGKAKP